MWREEHPVVPTVYRVDGLRRCVIVRRINRFVVEILIDGKPSYAHLTNTGRLYDVLVKGRECVVTGIDGKKLRYRLIGVRDMDGYAVIDTLTQNRVFAYLVDHGLLPRFADCRVAGVNPRVRSGMLDFLLVCGGDSVLVETKSAVLRSPDNAAMYPDCPSLRGRRHLREIMRMHEEGVRVSLVFVAAMPHPRCFKPYRGGDPVLAELIGEAVKRGVDVGALSLYMDEAGGIILENPELPLCPEWLSKLNNPAETNI